MRSGASQHLRQARRFGTGGSIYNAQPVSAFIPSDYGLGGRSSVSPYNCALFGATGFLGRYVASELGSIGSKCNIGNRGCEMETRHLKVAFDLGRYHAPYYSPRDVASIDNVIGDSNVVVNMIGKYYQTKGIVPKRKNKNWSSLSTINYDYEEVNVDIPRRLARQAREAGVKTFIHVSSIAADHNSKSAIGRTKAAGEEAVMEEFPDATIIRPCPMFGAEDRLLNWFATQATYPSGSVPLVEDGVALLQPVYVYDVARAIVKCMRYPELFKGRKIDLAGPSEYTRRELAEFVFEVTEQPVSLYDSSTEFAKLQAALIDFLPVPNWVPEDVILSTIDQVVEPNTANLTFPDLSITPTPLEKIAFSYLHRYRTGGHFIHAKGYHSL